ncbi:hypothetical protein BCR37DRAFT_353645 [Protomyces lactucae-debilis]|uniref:PIN domain-like protein n=1 Tax=Protomyces lactucae-debilis TaxID=2754530 RepID=A0A1Y2FUZ0_PROLT|nr:uncharacterized protein BCR37DRAFT_353645 [Protomyces lactucae-debilis]ORY87818.1 hypothetical protein BCR37DRAFT_353645 [Protomyces lactucae-debilis]
MGVTGLWTVLEPGARPVRLESLAKKRLAIDASIWIYQFLKAVRDKEGNVLRNAHIVGFFRRICKLLFHGIKPVFVFDGVAPLLKKQTLRARKQFRDGGRVDVVKTAGKILAVQMRKRAAEQIERDKLAQQHRDDDEEAVPENPTYFDEVALKPAEQAARKFKRTDQYHLPELANSLDRAGSLNDPRLMTPEELAQYAKDFDNQDLGVSDFSHIDYDAEWFKSLPQADQYSILNAARLRSRLRMGLSTEQLTDMFPDRMAFSRFQIERVKERSDLTNRLMNLNGMNESGPQRIASERGREYVLVKNDDVNGGWSLGVVNTAEQPIIIDKEEKVESDVDDDDDFEDVPIERIEGDEVASSERQMTEAEMIKWAIEESRKAQLSTTRPDPSFRPSASKKISSAKGVPTPLFREDTDEQQAVRKLSFKAKDDEEADLRRAIQLSLRKDEDRLEQAKQSQQGGFLIESEDEDVAMPTSKVALSGDPAASSDARAAPVHAGFVIESDDEEIQVPDHPTTTQDVKSPRKEDAPPNSLGRTANQRRSTRPQPVEKLSPIPVPTKETSPPPWFEIAAVPPVPFRPAPRPKTPSPEPVQPTTIIRDESTIDLTDDVKAPASITDIQDSPMSVVEDEVPEVADHQQSQVQAGSPDWSDLEEEEQADEVPEPDAPITLDRHSSQLDEADMARLAEEDAMEEQMAREENEYARFSAELSSKAAAYTQEEYEDDLKRLKGEQRRNLRDADEVTQVMVQECQALLAHFGIPYMTAPTEAEAQCATLLQLDLVDGIVTDDSDVFLFGGTRVYKNMFNDAKTVECFILQDLEREFRLDRQQLINLAYLLGSDYTEGIKKVGPVTAVELLAEFRTSEESDATEDACLTAFSEWVDRVQAGRESADDLASPFRRKFRKTAEKLVLPDAFPNPMVRQAYLQPEVDADTTAFVWGQPDVDTLRRFLMRQIGWSAERTDEILLPVIKDMNRKLLEGTQRNLTDFFGGVVGSGTMSAIEPGRRKHGKTASSRMSRGLSALKRAATGEAHGEGAAGTRQATASGGTRKRAAKDASEAPVRKRKQVETLPTHVEELSSDDSGDDE